jgi:hypothetical protein
MKLKHFVLFSRSAQSAAMPRNARQSGGTLPSRPAAFAGFFADRGKKTTK